MDPLRQDKARATRFDGRPCMRRRRIRQEADTAPCDQAAEQETGKAPGQSRAMVVQHGFDKVPRRAGCLDDAACAIVRKTG
jgi:hypothetical protein